MDCCPTRARAVHGRDRQEPRVSVLLLLTRWCPAADVWTPEHQAAAAGGDRPGYGLQLVPGAQRAVGGVQEGQAGTLPSVILLVRQAASQTRV
jgi:hypothetical protein